MNGFTVIEGQTLRVNILTDGPTISANYRDNELVVTNEDLGDVYIKSAAARTQLMQNLMGDRDVGNLRPVEKKP